MIGSNIFDRLLNHFVSLRSKYRNDINYVLCRDMNVHTLDYPDFVENDNCIHADFLPEDYSTDQYMKRY